MRANKLRSAGQTQNANGAQGDSESRGCRPVWRREPDEKSSGRRAKSSLA